MSADKEASHCRVQAVAFLLYHLHGQSSDCDVEHVEGLLAEQREDARQQLVPHLAKLRAENKALRDMNAATFALCLFPDGLVGDGTNDVGEPYLLVSSIKKVLGES